MSAVAPSSRRPKIATIRSAAALLVAAWTLLPSAGRAADDGGTAPVPAASAASGSFALPTLATSPPANDGALLSERDFLVEIPKVFSASRLPQAPADSPNAVTVIDREMIRALGARDVADLFRLVPGFVNGSPSGGRAVVAYHGLAGQISQRMQVLLDGRSLYAPYSFGGIDWNTLPIGLDDIERIEVLRGSNSAAYGANAFLGVANIITRTGAQSRGGHASVATGGHGIRDLSMRYGGGSGNLGWRLSAGQVADDGLEGAFDTRRNRYVGTRGEWQLGGGDELAFAAGHNENRLGLGRTGSAGDPERYESTSTSFGQLRWQRSIADDEAMSLAASYTVDRGDDSYTIPVTPTDGLLIDYGRRAERAHLEYQHWLGLNEALRGSWGAEFRRDSVVAPQLFNTSDSQRSQAVRAYLNLEWTPSPHWTVNAGGLIENDSLSGTHFAPRLVGNWKVTPDHTLRLGYSEAFRTPSLFEQRSDWRFVYNGETIDIRYLSRGGLGPERPAAPGRHAEPRRPVGAEAGVRSPGAAALWISARCVKACGKLPRKAPLVGVDLFGVQADIVGMAPAGVRTASAPRRHGRPAAARRRARSCRSGRRLPRRSGRRRRGSAARSRHGADAPRRQRSCRSSVARDSGKSSIGASSTAASTPPS